MINNIIGRKSGIRYQNFFIIIGSQCSIHKINLYDLTYDTFCFNKISGFEFLEKDNQRAACNICQAVLYCKSYSYRCGSECCNYR